MGATLTQNSTNTDARAARRAKRALDLACGFALVVVLPIAVWTGLATLATRALGYTIALPSTLIISGLFALILVPIWAGLALSNRQ